MTRRGATRGAWVILAIGAALYLAARTTGAGWLVVLICGLAGVMIAAVLGPWLALRRVSLRGVGDADATAGDPMGLTLSARRAGVGIRLLPLDPPGEVTAIVGAGSTHTEVVPPVRGILEAVTIEVGSAAPFGLVWWRRRLSAPLERPTEIAPRRPAADAPRGDGGASEGASRAAAGIDGDHVRSLREYLPGDPLRLVHWPATARHGQTMVKEREHPQPPRVVVALDLTGPPALAEPAAERAMGVLCTALDEGFEVVLSTVERDGPTTGPVTSHRHAGRRLARAVSGRPAPPDGLGAVHWITATGVAR